MHRPVRRGTLAEHLYRAVAKPKSGENQRLRNALGKGLKYAVGGAVFYFGVALALGGRERVRADLEKLQVCSYCMWQYLIYEWLERVQGGLFLEATWDHSAWSSGGCSAACEGCWAAPLLCM